MIKFMDTEDLSEMACDTIRLAYMASDYLKAEIGAMCSQLKSEIEKRGKSPFL